jgi:hypothetical protein
MFITNRPELSPEERRLPLAKYYDLPLSPPGPLYQQILDNGPLDPKLAIKAQDFLDLLKPTGYDEQEYGYCVMEDGTGYLAVYTTYQNCTPEMLAWWFRWLNVHSKSMPEGKGNLKYKIWCPPDHWDHVFLNKNGYTDRRGGIGTVESLDLGQGEDMFYTIRHYVDLREFGFTEQREQELEAAGCWVDCAYESFYTHPAHTPLPGAHLQLTLSRMSPLGYMEKRTREWIGYKVKDGKVVRDETTPDEMFTEEYLRKVLIHCTIEAQHLSEFLPQLYAEYKDRPDDED